jgi:hypothetical protein
LDWIYLAVDRVKWRALVNTVMNIHHHHWLDSPVWALAFFRSFRQSSLSIAAISS